MASIAVTARSNNTANQTTYAFADQATGAEDATKYVLFGVTGQSVAAGGAAGGIASATIGGNAATPLVSRIGDDDGFCAIYGAAQPAGTTLSFEITWGFAAARCSLITAAAIGGIDAGSVLSNSDTDNDTVGNVTQSLSVNTFADGVAFGIAQAATVTNIDFTGLTDDTLQTNEAMGLMAALADIVTGETPRSISVLFTTAGSVLRPSSCVVSFAPAGDVTAPVLSNATATETGETTASLAVDTDEGNGTLFWVVTTSATPPSSAQVAAGQDHTGAPAADSGSQAVSGTGTQNVAGGAAGLAAGTTYWAHFVQDDDATNRSNVDSSGSFTTDAVAPPVTPVDLEEGAGGGGRRRGRRYPYPNVIDDGWDWDAPDARAEPKAAPEPPVAPEKALKRAPEGRKPAGLSQAAKAETPLERAKKALESASGIDLKLLGLVERAEKPAADDKRVAALETEVEELRTQVAELKAKRRQDDEEERLLSWFLEDE